MCSMSFSSPCFFFGEGVEGRDDYCDRISLRQKTNHFGREILRCHSRSLCATSFGKVQGPSLRKLFVFFKMNFAGTVLNKV